MTKIIAGALFAICIYLFGSAKASRLREKQKQEDGLISLLHYIKTSVITSGTPLVSIYGSFYDKSLDECGFLRALTEKDGNGTIRYAIDKCKSNLSADSDLLASLCNFSDILCVARNRTQVKDICEKYINDLECELPKRRAKDNSSAELYMKLSPLAALSVFLLLI